MPCRHICPHCGQAFSQWRKWAGLGSHLFWKHSFEGERPKPMPRRIRSRYELKQRRKHHE